VAEHSRAAHKLALLENCPHTFISAGEDGLVIEVDLRQPKPTTLLVKTRAGF
jgi:WD repeat-containing protein 42A